MNIAEARLDAAILAEESKLEAIGLTVKPLGPEEDAALDYSLAAEAIRRTGAVSERDNGLMSSGSEPLKSPEEVMPLLEKASRGLALKIPTDDKDISLCAFWWEVRIGDVTNQADLTSLDELAAIGSRMDLQLAMGSKTRHARLEVDGLPEPIDGVIFSKYRNPLVREWLRRRLESYDPLPKMRASLSGAILRLRAAVQGTGGVIASPRSVREQIDQLIEGHGLFRQSADLALLRALNRVASKILGQSKDSGRIGALDEPVEDELARMSTWPAKWAKVHMGPRPPFDSAVFLELERRGKLIELDLRNSYFEHKPLKLTWSKRYLVDPSNGAQLILSHTEHSANYERFLLIERSGTFSTVWSHDIYLSPDL